MKLSYLLFPLSILFFSCDNPITNQPEKKIIIDLTSTTSINSTFKVSTENIANITQILVFINNQKFTELFNSPFEFVYSAYGGDSVAINMFAKVITNVDTITSNVFYFTLFRLNKPTINFLQLNENKIKLFWNDNNSVETNYLVYLMINQNIDSLILPANQTEIVLDLDQEKVYKFLLLALKNSLKSIPSDTLKLAYRINNMNLIFEKVGQNSPISSINVSHDSSFVLTTGYIDFGPNGKHAIQWDLYGNLMKSFIGAGRGYNTSAISHSDNTFVSAGDSTLQIWDINSGQNIYSTTTNVPKFYSILYSSNYIVAAGYSKSIRVFNKDNLTPIKSIQAHDLEINTLCYNPSINQIITGSEDKLIKIFDLENNTLIATFSGHTDGVKTLHLSTDRKFLFSSSNSGSILKWNLQTYSLEETMSIGPAKTIIEYHDYIIYSNGLSLKFYNVKDKKNIFSISIGGYYYIMDFKVTDDQLFIVNDDGRFRKYSITLSWIKI